MQPILTIDLTTGKTSEFKIPTDWERDYLGGASLAARILYSSLVKDLDPFSAESPLLFIGGPLSGTAGPAMGRFVVCGRSPVTGLWAESNCGGFWVPELRACGYDGLWITGKANAPAFLWLNDEKLEILDAKDCWGKGTDESQQIIKSTLLMPDAHVLTIGPAGENGVLFAGFFCDHGRAAARTGLGAIAGSKNLKAIAVKGSNRIPLSTPDRYAQLRSHANKALLEDNIAQVTHALGTAGVADYADYLGSMPKKYFHQGTMDNVDKVSGSTMSDTILKRKRACHACVIACGREVDLGDGGRRKGPEYETIVGFGPNLLNDDLAEIVRLNETCDALGMDTISASNTIGLAYHLFEKGVIDEQTVGFCLRWGDTKAAARLLPLIAQREGIGEWMSLGARRFATHFGVEDEAVQVNGLEIPYHDPRGVSGMALVYATSPRGACHNKSDYFFVDWGQADPSLGLDFMDQRGEAGKAANVARHQNWRSVTDSLIMCLFSNIAPEMILGLINAACGYDCTMEDLLLCGERGWNLKRVINHRLGLTRQNDTLPKALLEPLSDGSSAGYSPDLHAMLTEYYAVRGWDALSGKPTVEKLKSLGLDWTEKDIWD